MADLAAGTWTLVRSDNLEEYMKAVGEWSVLVSWYASRPSNAQNVCQGRVLKGKWTCCLSGIQVEVCWLLA